MTHPRFSFALVAAAMLLVIASQGATKQPGYPAPHITAPTVPTAVAPGGPGFTLKVYGANFINGSVVNWNKQARTTTFVSGHELDAQILASDIATNTAGLITVTTTSPGGPITSSTFAQVEVHAPTTTVTFGSPQFTPTGIPLLLADINGDGYLDAMGNNGQMETYLNNGLGIFTPIGFATHDFNSNGSALLGDFNGDGISDLLFEIGKSNLTTRLQVNLGNGDGTFRPESTFTYFPFSPSNVVFVMGDFNQDGVLDVAVQSGSTSLNIFFGNGDGTFSKGQTVSTGGGVIGMVVGDFNDDGKLDIAAEVGLAGQPEQVRILLGNGDGTFRTLVVLSNLTGFLGYPKLVVTDVNGDGIADLMYNQNAQMAVLLGRGDGTFKNLGFLPDLTDGMAVGDFNSDGKMDLIFWGNVGQSSCLRLGNGDGTFGSDQAVNISLTNDLNPAADFNNDGLLDVFDGYINLRR